MPLLAQPADQEFSYERDVQPYEARYFDRVSADPGLTEQARTRLQGSLLKDSTDIETQRMKLQEERDQSAMKKLQYTNGLSELEDARLRRKRIQDNDAALSGVQGAVQGIINSDGSPDDKRMALAGFQLNHGAAIAANPNAAEIVRIGHAAIPPGKEPALTTAQAISSALQGEDPALLAEAIKNNDFSGVAARARHRELDKAAAKEGQFLRHQEVAEARSAKDKLANESLKFVKDEGNMETDYLTDESTIKATGIVHALAETPEEIQHYQKLMTNKASDRERKNYVDLIQTKYLLKKARAAASDAPEETAPKLRAADVTGFGK
jgi:hypothetical protein